MPLRDRPILLFEPHSPSLRRTAALIEQVGYSVVTAATTAEAVGALEEGGLAALLVAYGPEGIELCDYVREFTAAQLPIGAMLGQASSTSGSTHAPESADQIVSEMGADGFLRRPFTAATLESFLSMATRLARVRGELRDLRLSVSELEGRVQRSGLTLARTGFLSFEAVKDLLVLEVRRAKRYGYPLSVLMVGLDPVAALAEQIGESTLAREITAGLAVAISKSIRVIDLPIQYADDRILVFLPHTDLAGGEEAGRRIKRRIKRITYRGTGRTVQLTASVGVAGISAGDDLTFSKLIKNATIALKAAQLKGGDKLMKRVVRPVPAA